MANIDQEKIDNRAWGSERDDHDDESEEARLDRLGRQRPPVFKTAVSELAFGVSIMLSITMAEYYISGFNMIIPTLTTSLNIPASGATWPASSFSLVAGAFFLISGRLADMFGGWPLFVGGLSWQAIWSLAAGFAPNAIALDVCRAIQGLGPAAFLPASLLLIGKTYRPGPRKNRVFSIYGACAPIGMMAGILVSGLASQWLSWRWYFWIGSMLTGLSAGIGVLAVPSDARKTHDDVHMDWWGSLSTVATLVLLVAAVTQSSRAPQGWATPYIIVLLLLSMVALGISVWIEGWVADYPLLPFDMFRVKGMPAVTVALFFSYGVLGTWLFYATFFLQEVLQLQPMIVVAWFLPFGLGGVIIPTIVGTFLHLVSGTVLLIVAAMGWVATPLLTSFIEPGMSYWRLAFPAMICATIGIDTTYNITNIWITTSMVESRQGLAAALINSLMFLSNSFFLGWADVLHSHMLDQGKSLRESYQIVLWYISGLAGVALVLFILFVRVDKAKGELTADEKLQRAAGIKATKETSDVPNAGNKTEVV